MITSIILVTIIKFWGECRIMEKSLLVFVLIVGGILYGVQYFVGNMEEEYMSDTSQYARKYERYIKKDSVGQVILVFPKNTKLETQLDVWKNSPLKEEFLAYFPQYNELELFVKDRMNGELLKNYMLKVIVQVKEDFLKGKIDGAQAKLVLSELK